VLHRLVDTRLRPDQTRSLEAEEESYFNADDDDDDDGVLPSISQQARGSAMGSLIPIPSGALSPGKLLATNSSINPLKRKRRGDVGTTRGRRPPLRAPVMRSLVDYGEDEDEESSEAKRDDSDGHDNKAVDSSPALAPSPIPMTSGLAGGPPGRPVKEEDEEESKLETLLRGRTSTPGPRSEPPLSALSPPVRGGKRRRVNGEEDDDDEMLSKLTKPRKHQFVFASAQQNKNALVDPVAGPSTQPKNGEMAPKKMKVKIGGFANTLVSGSNTTRNTQPSGMTVDPPSNDNSNPPQTASSSPSPSQPPAPSPSPSPTPSDTGIKDGDTG
jgi:protein phosphatase-4 regulatory subunit 3